MSERQTRELQRRDFLIALRASIASICASTISLPWIGPATAAQNTDKPQSDPTPAFRGKFEPALNLEAMVQNLLKSGETLPRRMSALAYSVSSLDSPINATMATAEQIASGSKIAWKKDSLSKLRNTFETAISQNELFQFPRNLAPGFDGLVDEPAAFGVMVADMAIHSMPQTSNFHRYSTTLPTSTNAPKILKPVLAVLLESKIAEETRFGMIALEPLKGANGDVSNVTKMLPENCRDFAREVVKIVDGKHAVGQLEQILARKVHSAIQTGQEAYGHIADEIERGKIDARKAVESSPDAAADINAITTIGSFVIRELLNDRTGADQFQRGMEVASLALTVGLLVSTGGVGCLGAVAGIMSGIDTLGGAPAPKNGSAAEEAYFRLASQIENLRLEMHQRFDRLELMEFKTLGLLSELSKDLKAGNQIVSNKLDEIQSSILRLERYVTGQDRKRSLNEFNDSIRKAKGAIEAGDESEKKGYTEKDKKDVLFAFLGHAIDVSSDKSFIGHPGGPFAASVKAAERVDLVISQLGNAAQILKLREAPEFDHNPVEWARGVQAFIEAQTALNFQSGAVANAAENAWEIGRVLREKFLKVLTAENLRRAIETFRAASDKLRLYLLANLKPTLRLGKPPDTTWDTDSSYAIWQFEDYPVPLAHYLYSRTEVSEYFDEWRCLLLRGRDPIWLAKEAGVIFFHEGAAKQVINRGFWGENTEIPFTIGTQTEITIVNRKGAPLGSISLIDIDVTKVFRADMRDVSPHWRMKLKAYDFSSADAKTAIPAIWNAILREFDDGEEIKKQIDSLSANDPILLEFERVAAAFALFTSSVSWRITDQLDDPWRSAISSQMLRSMEDVRDELIELSQGMNGFHSKLLSPIRVASEDPIIGAEGVLKYARIRMTFIDSGDARQRPWSNLDAFVSYPTLFNTVFTNHIEKSVKAAEKLIPLLPDTNVSIGLIDRSMSKFNSYLALQHGI